MNVWCLCCDVIFFFVKQKTAYEMRSSYWCSVVCSSDLALLMAPLAILAILFLPTPWMAVLAAVVFLAGLWEWLKLAEVDDTLHRTILLLLNLLLMVLMVWAAQGSFVLLQIVAVAGVGWWLLEIGRDSGGERVWQT